MDDENKYQIETNGEEKPLYGRPSPEKVRRLLQRPRLSKKQIKDGVGLGNY